MRESVCGPISAAALSGLLLVWSAAAAATIDQGVQPGDICPLSTPTYSASLDRARYDALSGIPFDMRVQLSPGDVPPGFFVTVNVERLTGPQTGRVESLSGFPATRITCSEPGDYRLSVRVALVAKASCGGVKASILLDRDVDVVAR
jgi:hypothetical protein